MSTVPHDSRISPQTGAITLPMPAIPPLASGDRMSRTEFHRRYEQMPEVKKAELLEGTVIVGSPVSTDFHGKQDGLMTTWIGVYAAHTPGVESATNATVILDEDNEPQPDILLRRIHGASKTNEQGYIVGPPELVVEIAASSVSYDLHAKKNVFRRSGVKEYVVWRVFDATIDWFALRSGEYVPQSLDATGILKSEVFPGLWLDVPAMLRHDLSTVLQRLQTGVASEDHQAFIATLAK